MCVLQTAWPDLERVLGMCEKVEHRESFVFIGLTCKSANLMDLIDMQYFNTQAHRDLVYFRKTGKRRRNGKSKGKYKKNRNRCGRKNKNNNSNNNNENDEELDQLLNDLNFHENTNVFYQQKCKAGKGPIDIKVKLPMISEEKLTAADLIDDMEVCSRTF